MSQPPPYRLTQRSVPAHLLLLLLLLLRRGHLPLLALLHDRPQAHHGGCGGRTAVGGLSGQHRNVACRSACHRCCRRHCRRKRLCWGLSRGTAEAEALHEDVVDVEGIVRGGCRRRTHFGRSAAAGAGKERVACWVDIGQELIIDAIDLHGPCSPVGFGSHVQRGVCRQGGGQNQVQHIFGASCLPPICLSGRRPAQAPERAACLLNDIRGI